VEHGFGRARRRPLNSMPQHSAHTKQYGCLDDMALPLSHGDVKDSVHSKSYRHHFPTGMRHEANMKRGLLVHVLQGASHCRRSRRQALWCLHSACDTLLGRSTVCCTHCRACRWIAAA